MRRMMLFVNLRYGVDEPVVVTLTNGVTIDMTTAALEFPAGLGRHRIVVMVGDKEYVRTFTVYQCGKGIKPARME